MFWAVLRTELRLIVRRRSFWVVQTLIHALTLLTWFEQTTMYDPTGLGFISRAISFVLIIELLLLPVVVGPSITREFGTTGDVAWATPLDALTHFLGMLAGLWLALAPMLFVQIGVRWLVGIFAVETRPELLWIYGLPLILIGVTAGLGIVVLLGMLVRRTVPLLIVWVALWGMNTYLLANRVPIEMGVPFRFLLQLPNFNLNLSPALGLGLFQPLVRGLALWFSGVALTTLLLGLLAALWSDRRRTLRYVAPVLIWALVAAMVQGNGYVLHARAASLQAPPFSPRDNQLDGWVVREHSLNAIVDAQQSNVEGTSTIILETTQPTTTNTIVLHFNPGMRLTSVQDAAGQALRSTRQGDSVIVTLPTVPTGPFTLQLTWQGTPRPAATDYTYTYDYQDAVTQSQPVRSLLTNSVSYLLRDGDWYPWPWTTQPHQAEQTTFALKVTDPRALTTTPLDNGTATWNGQLPSALLVVPPTRQVNVGTTTLYVGELTLPRMIEQLTSLVATSNAFFTAVGEQPPQQVIALPYLSDIVWSDELLLVPEGTARGGFTVFNASHLTVDVHERATTSNLAQSWLSTHLPLPAPLTWMTPGYVDLNKPRGRWIESAAYDYLDPSAEEQRTLGLAQQQRDLTTWIAIERADPAVREADLAFLQQSDAARANMQTNGNENQENDTIGQVLNSQTDRWLFPTDSALIYALHDWAWNKRYR
jgi:hypothetical protein